MANLEIILPTILLTFTLPCLAGESRSLNRSIDPIEVSGFEVPAISGAELSNLRVMVSRNGSLEAIPFQIDQKNSANDWVWDFVTINDESSGKESQIYDDQDPARKRIFDANDVVVFLAKDTGDKDRKGIARVAADKIVELEITDTVDQSKGWVYLVYFKSNAPALSDVRYVQYEPENYRVKGPDHEFLYSPDQTMVLDDFRLDGISVFVSNKIRGEVKAGIGPFTFSFEINEKDFSGYNDGYIDGPVRIVKRSIERVRLGMGITSPPVNCDHFHYPWHAEIPVLISKHTPIHQVSILATSIFHSANFTRVDTDAEWIGLSGEGLSIINSVKIPKEHEKHIDVSPYLTEIGDASDTRDAKLVSGIEVGFKIRTTDRTPEGDHIVHSVFLFSANSNGEEHQMNAIKMLKQKLILSAVTLTR